MKYSYTIQLQSNNSNLTFKTVFIAATFLLISSGQLLLAQQKVGDNLGNHVADKNLQMKSFQVLNTSGVAIGTATITGGNSIGLQLAGGKAIQVTNVGALTEIATPVAGMVVYLTTNNLLYIYQGTAWTALSVSTLNDGQVRIGNSSNIGVARTITGDITLSNTGASLIQNSAVTTDKIADGNVTAAKLATVGNSKILATNTSGANEWASLVKKILVSANVTLTAAQLTPGRMIMLQNSNVTTGAAAFTVTLPSNYKFSNTLSGNLETTISIPGGGNATIYIAETATAAPGNLFMVDIVGINNPASSSSSSTSEGDRPATWYYAQSQLAAGDPYIIPTKDQPTYWSNGWANAATTDPVKNITKAVGSNGGSIFALIGGRSYEVEAYLPYTNSNYGGFSVQWYMAPLNDRLNVNPSVLIPAAVNPVYTPRASKAMFYVPVNTASSNQVIFVACKVSWGVNATPRIDAHDAYLMIKEIK